MRKKLLSFLLTGIMMISSTACNPENTEVSIPKNSEEEAQERYSQENLQETEREQSTDQYEDNVTENSEETVYEAALEELIGTNPVYDDTLSESGTKKWKWVSEDRIISLMWSGQILSINMNLAVGNALYKNGYRMKNASSVQIIV